MSPVVEVDGVIQRYAASRSILGFGDSRSVTVLDDVSFSIRAGEIVGLVGESGCGKTTTARLMLKLEDPSSGAIKFHGRSLASMNSRETRQYRRKVQPVFQDPYSSLNPRRTIRDAVEEPLVVNSDASRSDRTRIVEEALDNVGIPRRSLPSYPHEFSGGQRQRIAIARALCVKPELLILDEPVSALDVSVRAQIVNLLLDLREAHALTYFLISHDLGLVQHVADRILVMYLGTVVESGSARDVARRRLHPYTSALFASALSADPRERKTIEPISGELPSPASRPPGCPFAARCPRAMPHCSVTRPALREVDGISVACHLY